MSTACTVCLVRLQNNLCLQNKSYLFLHNIPQKAGSQHEVPFIVRGTPVCSHEVKSGGEDDVIASSRASRGRRLQQRRQPAFESSSRSPVHISPHSFSSLWKSLPASHGHKQSYRVRRVCVVVLARFSRVWSQAVQVANPRLCPVGSRQGGRRR